MLEVYEYNGRRSRQEELGLRYGEVCVFDLPAMQDPFDIHVRVRMVLLFLVVKQPLTSLGRVWERN